MSHNAFNNTDVGLKSAMKEGPSGIRDNVILNLMVKSPIEDL